MACFLAPAAAAIITTRVRKKIAPKYHPEWLIAMLWGGVVMLVVDHIASGEILPYPPFLSAMRNPADISLILREIGTVGVAMTAAVVLAWALMVLVANNAGKALKKYPSRFLS